MEKVLLSKEEIIKLSVILNHTLEPDEILEDFPNFVIAQDLVSQDEINDYLAQTIEKFGDDPDVVINRKDLIHLYSYTSAVLGFEETTAKYPAIRMLILNTLNEKELGETLDFIRTIELQIKSKFE